MYDRLAYRLPLALRAFGGLIAAVVWAGQCVLFKPKRLL